MLALREAAYSDETDPRLWALYGAQCLKLGRFDRAEHALGHAAWLRERRREHGKAKATRAVLDQQALGRVAA